MSADSNNEQRLLEQATTAESPPGEELTPEARSLREAWLAFGQLLEAAQPQATPRLEALDAAPTIAPPAMDDCRRVGGVLVARPGHRADVDGREPAR